MSYLIAKIKYVLEASCRDIRHLPRRIELLIFLPNNLGDRGQPIDVRFNESKTQEIKKRGARELP
jgi:hypothetical protein